MQLWRKQAPLRFMKMFHTEYALSNQKRFVYAVISGHVSCILFIVSWTEELQYFCICFVVFMPKLVFVLASIASICRRCQWPHVHYLHQQTSHCSVIPLMSDLWNRYSKSVWISFYDRSNATADECDRMTCFFVMDSEHFSWLNVGKHKWCFVTSLDVLICLNNQPYVYLLNSVNPGIITILAFEV